MRSKKPKLREHLQQLRSSRTEGESLVRTSARLRTELKDGGPLDPPKQSVNPVEFPLMSKVLTQRNKDLPWVDRVLSDDPTIIPEPGTVGTRESTHRLSYNTHNDGSGTVFPTIVKDGFNHLSNLEGRGGSEHARKTKTGMNIPSQDLAAYYSQNGLIQHKTGGPLKPDLEGIAKEDKVNLDNITSTSDTRYKDAYEKDQLVHANVPVEGGEGTAHKKIGNLNEITLSAKAPTQREIRNAKKKKAEAIQEKADMITSLAPYSGSGPREMDGLMKNMLGLPSKEERERKEKEDITKMQSNAIKFGDAVDPADMLNEANVSDSNGDSIYTALNEDTINEIQAENLKNITENKELLAEYKEFIGMKQGANVDISKYYGKYKDPKEFAKNEVDVKVIQAALHKQGYYDGIYPDYTPLSKIIDGKFGPKTNRAYNYLYNDNTVSSINNRDDMDVTAANSVSDIQSTIFSQELPTFFIPSTFNFTGTPDVNSVRLSTAYAAEGTESGEYECVVGMYEHFDPGRGQYDNGFNGSAWQFGEIMTDSGFATQINDYQGYPAATLGRNATKGQISAYAINQIQNANYDEESFQEGDILELYYHNSGNMETAWGDAREKVNTHGGWISIGPDGLKYVNHNVGKSKSKNTGAIHTELLSDVLKRKKFNKSGTIGVLGSYRSEFIEKRVQPKEYYDDADLGITLNPNLTNYSNMGSEQSVDFFSNMVAVAVPIQNDFNFSNDELELVVKISLSVPFNESRYGQKEHNLTDVKSSSDLWTWTKKTAAGPLVRNDNAISNYTQDVVEDKMGEKLSSGPAQLKHNNISQEAALRYGITKENLQTTEGASRASMVYIASTYKYLKQMRDKHPELGLDDPKTLERVLWSSYNADIFEPTKAYLANASKNAKSWEYMSPARQAAYENATPEEKAIYFSDYTENYDRFYTDKYGEPTIQVDINQVLKASTAMLPEMIHGQDFNRTEHFE